MTDPARGPTTEELRARVLWIEQLSDPTAVVAAPLLERACLACNREPGEPMCVRCQRLEVAEAAAARPPLDSEGAERQ